MSGEVVDIRQEVRNSKETQWHQVSDRVFQTTGINTPKLPPGYYKIHEQMGGLFFEQQVIEYAGILKSTKGNTGEIIKDIEAFWEMEKQFTAYKVPYKRGLMLSGPPGTGKTCIIKLILGDIISRGGICIEVDAYHIGTFRKGYDKIRTVQPDVPIIAVMEDMH